MSLGSTSSMETPRISKPWAAYFLCRSTSHGISILHGPHQVAQKFTITALPRREESETVLPSGTLFKENSGAREPMAGSAPEGAGYPLTFCFVGSRVSLGLDARLPTRSNPVITTTTHKTTMTFRFKTISSQRKAV